MGNQWVTIIICVILGGVIVPLILNWLMDRGVGWKEKIIIAICVIISCILTKVMFDCMLI